jgi:predicted Zn-dependent peptidase
MRSFPLAALAAVAALTVVVSAQQAPDRSKAPALGPAPSLRVPPIQKRALSNGLPVWIVEMHKVPVVDVMLIIKSGASADPADKFGLASMTAGLLMEGAGTRSGLELSDAVEFLGASLTATSATDSSTIRLHLPLSKLDDGLPLMADVTLRPMFAQPDLDRVRKSRVTNIAQARDSPGTLVGLAFNRILYGPAHRYGTGSAGTDASMSSMSVADLTAFHAMYYQPSNAHLLVVGDVTAAAMMPKLEKALGAWKNTGPVARATLPAVPQHGARQIYVIDKPKAAQSQIRIGWIGVARSTPDFFPLEILNTILGGSYTSRLNWNLRQEHGYSYGASSVFDMRVSAGPFYASAGVQTDKTVESVQEFCKELDRIREPIPEAELDQAKNLDALAFPGSFEATTSMTAHLADLVLYGLPDTYFNEYVPKIQAVTSADLSRVAKQYIQPDHFAIVIIGDVSKIEKPLRDANIAPVRILTADEIVR